MAADAITVSTLAERGVDSAAGRATSAGGRGDTGTGREGARYVGSFQLSRSLSPVLLSRVLCSV